MVRKHRDRKGSVSREELGTTIKQATDTKKTRQKKGCAEGRREMKEQE